MQGVLRRGARSPGGSQVLVGGSSRDALPGRASASAATWSPGRGGLTVRRGDGASALSPPGERAEWRAHQGVTVMVVLAGLQLFVSLASATEFVLSAQASR